MTVEVVVVVRHGGMNELCMMLKANGRASAQLRMEALGLLEGKVPKVHAETLTLTLYCEVAQTAGG